LAARRWERDMDQAQLFREQATLARSVANWQPAIDRIAMFELSNIWVIAAQQIERQTRAQINRRPDRYEAAYGARILCASERWRGLRWR
jgi:hypothetical protein